MNRTTILVAAVLPMVSSCASFSGGGVSSSSSLQSAHNCKAGPVKVINAERGASIMKVIPKVVCAPRNGTVIFKIIPSRNKNTARTKQGAGNPEPAAWLDKGNTKSESEMMLTVSATAILGLYKYSITIDGVGTLDPHAEVIPE